MNETYEIEIDDDIIDRLNIIAEKYCTILDSIIGILVYRCFLDMQASGLLD